MIGNATIYVVTQYVIQLRLPHDGHTAIEATRKKGNGADVGVGMGSWRGMGWDGGNCKVPECVDT